MEDVDVLRVLAAQLLVRFARSSGSSIPWSWLKKTALIAASGPITAMEAVGQGEAAVGVVRRARHRVQPGAVGLAHDHADLRHRGLGDGADHLGSVTDDPLALDGGADHESGHVGEKEQGDAERVARLDEARRLVGAVDEQHAALDLRLVGDDADRPAVQPPVADDQFLGPAEWTSKNDSASIRESSSSRMSNGLFSSSGTISRIELVRGGVAWLGHRGTHSQWEGKYDR